MRVPSTRAASFILAIILGNGFMPQSVVRGALAPGLWRTPAVTLRRENPRTILRRITRTTFLMRSQLERRHWVGALAALYILWLATWFVGYASYGPDRYAWDQAAAAAVTGLVPSALPAVCPVLTRGFSSCRGLRSCCWQGRG
jgi:hypothetical protein